MKNFIKTTDKPTADKLIAEGFKLVSQIGNVYTFLNEAPKNFNYEEVKKNIAYTNMLSL
jgi:hypothetical protein